MLLLLYLRRVIAIILVSLYNTSYPIQECIHAINPISTLYFRLEYASNPANSFSALERTFLAYIRTSVVIAMQGVLIAQLFRLQRSGSNEDRLKFYEVGIPLSVACHCVAVIVALIGAYRFWRQQSAVSLGKVHAGGWEVNSVGILLFLVSFTFSHWFQTTFSSSVFSFLMSKRSF